MLGNVEIHEKDVAAYLDEFSKAKDLAGRGAIAQLSLIARLDRYDFRLADQVTLLVGGLLCLILLMVSESYFREAVPRGVLAQRVIRVFAIEAVLAAVLYVVPILLAAIL